MYLKTSCFWSTPSTVLMTLRKSGFNQNFASALKQSETEATGTELGEEAHEGLGIGWVSELDFRSENEVCSAIGFWQRAKEVWIWEEEMIGSAEVCGTSCFKTWSLKKKNNNNFKVQTKYIFETMNRVSVFNLKFIKCRFLCFVEVGAA